MQWSSRHLHFIMTSLSAALQTCLIVCPFGRWSSRAYPSPWQAARPSDAAQQTSVVALLRLQEGHNACLGDENACCSISSNLFYPIDSLHRSCVQVQQTAAVRPRSISHNIPFVPAFADWFQA
jgi:hypothetical protein